MLSDDTAGRAGGPLPGRLVVVTGAGGLLGSAVTAALAAAGARLRTLIGPPGTPAPPVPLDGVEREARWGGMDDPEVIGPLVEGAHVVVHLAGPPSVAASFRQPAEFARSHVVGTATLWEAVARSAEPPRRVVHISSAEVYGPPETSPVGEDHPLRPASPYGAVKVAAEHLARLLAAETPAELVVLRPFSVYGPRSPAASLVGQLLRQAAAGQDLEVADLRPVHDYVHVDDVAAAVVAAATTGGAAEPGVYNVAGGQGWSVRQVAEALAAASGRPLAVRARADRADRPPAADLLHLVGDISRARRVLGWSPRIGLPDGLAAALQDIDPTPAPAPAPAPPDRPAAGTPGPASTGSASGPAGTTGG